MIAGDTLLKITDYPFSYSLVTILLLWAGVDIFEEQFVFLLGAAGSLGTLLAISDPVGRRLKQSLRSIFKKKRQSVFFSHSENDFQYCIRAIETKSIRIEIDKIVSLVYFSFILMLFSVAMIVSDSFALQLVSENNNQFDWCNVECIKIIFPSIAIIFMIIMIIVAKKDWSKIINYTEIAGVYQLSISSPNVTPDSRESMAKPIEQNDWQTASEWSHIIENEIKTERNKMKFIVQAINDVYRPLYEESLQLVASFSNIQFTNNYVTLPAEVWPRIKNSLSHLLVEDQDLKSEIESLYNAIKKYNEIPNTMEDDINKIISEKASEFYNANVVRVNYWTISKDGGHSAPALHDCILHDIHPLHRLGGDFQPDYIELQLKNSQQEPRRGPEELERFDEFFDIVKKEVKEKTRMDEMKEMFENVVKKHTELRPKIEEQIKKQWPDQYKFDSKH